MQHQVGRITFGPVVENGPYGKSQAASWSAIQALAGSSSAHACHCIGPQPGEKKCPCMLRGEAKQGRRMVEEGVVINGVEYDLVPRKAKG